LRIKGQGHFEVKSPFTVTLCGVVMLADLALHPHTYIGVQAGRRIGSRAAKL